MFTLVIVLVADLTDAFVTGMRFPPTGVGIVPHSWATCSLTRLPTASSLKLHSEQMALWDTASKRITQALGDATQVLTAEQRQKIGELLPQDRG